MPRETCTAPAILPLLSTSGASRTSTTIVLSFAIISCACAGVILGTTPSAASSSCLTLVVISDPVLAETAHGLCRADISRKFSFILGLAPGRHRLLSMWPALMPFRTAMIAHDRLAAMIADHRFAAMVANDGTIGRGVVGPLSAIIAHDFLWPTIRRPS